ncbi:hypothetical protein GCM10011371_01480 [Novosphingobium marinum]|uniref:DUF4440 domain-containing protein n=1 Tax=Novosphingobium marinum TaxID=1514948 RepID=A0A7Y9XUW9_9SPHN|nr:nuclear transport factor 2 family protein [Novosphingobium marinum]NYH93840.1 hypothetical protein [Novosphingobium marinum]GGC17675.1 hypothetical protein GCM10011371_01480 [Novosphingobium marinum]
MKSIAIPFALALGFAFQPASAQEWSPAQGEVWTQVSAAWEKHVDAGTWAEMLDPAGYGWNTNYPVPTSRSQMASRASVFGPEGKVLYYQLDPVKIAVNGDTAIAYYYANVVETNYKGERETMFERCADTMIKRGGSWRFLGWLCETKTSGDDD